MSTNIADSKECSIFDLITQSIGAFPLSSAVVNTSAYGLKSSKSEKSGVSLRSFIVVSFLQMLFNPSKSALISPSSPPLLS